MRTREESREYMREYRKRKRAEAAATILTMPTPKPSTEVADAVKQELAGLAASADHPAIAASAMRMAQILDDPKASPHYAAAARSLDVLLMRLHQASRGNNGGKLLAMRKARRTE